MAKETNAENPSGQYGPILLAQVANQNLIVLARGFSNTIKNTSTST